MELFEASDNPHNIRRWVPLGPHLITASGAPGRRRFADWPQLGVTTVVTLQRADEMPPWLEPACAENEISWRHTPVSGKRLEDPSDTDSLRQLLEIPRSLEDARHKIVLHCSAGLHRTGVALYLLLRARGLSPEDTIARIAQARHLTATELERRPRRGLRLQDIAENLWRELEPRSTP